MESTFAATFDLCFVQKGLALTCQAGESDAGPLPELTRIGNEAVVHSGISLSPGCVLSRRKEPPNLPTETVVEINNFLFRNEVVMSSLGENAH